MLANDEQYQKFIAYIAGVYADAEIEIMTLISKRLAEDIDVPTWAEIKLSEVLAVNIEIKNTLERIIKPSREVFIDGITKAYRAGYGLSETEILGPANKRALAALVKELLDKISGQYVQILRSADDVYRQTIADVTADTLTGVITRQQAANRALRTFADKGITGFIDKKGRQWGLAEYTEMATRTAYTRANLEGNLDKYKEGGYDLVYIPTSPEPCPLCDPLENKVYSARGLTEGYPLLRDAISKGLFHPNCTHRAVPYIEGLTKISERRPKEDRSKDYENRQVQRAIENRIRQAKRELATAITPEARKRANDKIKFHQNTMRTFIEETGRLRNSRRENMGVPVKPR